MAQVFKNRGMVTIKARLIGSNLAFSAKLKEVFWMKTAQITTFEGEEAGMRNYASRNSTGAFPLPGPWESSGPLGKAE